MKTGGNMTGVYVLLIIGVVMIVGAVFIYSSAEKNDFANYMQSLNEVKGNSNACVKNYNELAPKLDKLQSDVTELKMQKKVFLEEIGKALADVSQERDNKLENLRKEVEFMAAKQKHLEAKSQHPPKMDVNILNPVQVDIIPRQRPTVGQGKDSLLKRSGIVPETSK